MQNKYHKLQVGASYRMLQILDTSLTDIEAENTLINRIDYQLKLLKGMVQSNTYYEIGSGLELQKEFIYLEVPSGQGVYTWVDYNDDGIKDIGELGGFGFLFALVGQWLQQKLGDQVGVNPGADMKEAVLAPIGMKNSSYNLIASCV